MAKHNEIGKIGEEIAKTFLMKHFFEIVETNSRQGNGEIDIICRKDNVFHFVEVKSVEVSSFENLNNLFINPEENMTFLKRKNLKRSINLYLFNKNVSCETKKVIDLVCVYVNMETREGKVKFVENIEI